MDESAPIRAIVIGVSVLLAIATISGVLMYYNTAKQMASNVGRGQDFAANYEQSIQDILLTGSPNVTGNNSYITGADVIGMSPEDKLAVGSVILTPTARYIAFEDEMFTQKGV